MNPIQAPLIEKQSLTVTNTDVEGTTKVTFIKPLRLLNEKVVLGVFLSVLTCMLFPLVCSWSKRLVIRFFFQVCDLVEATHFEVGNCDGSTNISKKLDGKFGMYFLNRKIKYMYHPATTTFKAL